MIKVILSSSPNSGAPVARRAAKQTPYPDRKLKETHEMIFSWLSWVAVLLVGAYARRRQRRRRWSRARWRKMAARLTGIWSLWHWTFMLWLIDTCHTRHLLTSIRWPYRELKSTTHRGHVFFWCWPLTSVGFSIGSRAYVRLTCWTQVRIVRKPVNASPGLKFIRIITYKTEIKILSFPSWVSLIGHWTTRPRSNAFRLD